MNEVTKYLLFLTILLLTSCATRDYLPPTEGTSAELQAVLAKSLEENIKEIGFDPAGKTVDVQVLAFGGQQTSLGLERYVRSLFQEWIAARGGKVGPGEFQMVVFLPVLGTTATSREISYQYIPIYYSERYRSTDRLAVTVRDRGGEVVGTWLAGKPGDLADIYLLRMLRPFESH